MSIEELGKAIRKKRMSKSITQLELAQMLGFETAQYISNIERGLAFPPKKSLKKISAILGFPKKDLFEFFMKHETDDLRIWLYGRER